MIKCPSIEKCGASYSAWLNGDHPTVAQGSVKKKVCISRKSANHGGNCCYEGFFIHVKNYGSYFIYKLLPLMQGFSCDFRYCGTD